APDPSSFYPYVHCLACRGILGGYACGAPGEPCNLNHDPYFRPGALITRGQIAKIVSNSAGLSDDPGPTQMYEDVNSFNPFCVWINRLTHRGYMGGYTCGIAADEPCVPPANMPYFRPGSNATRGQLSKIVANAAGLIDPHTDQTFTDVPRESPFYVWIENLASRGYIGGYACGGVNPQTGSSEACDGQNRAWFRGANNVTRAQAAKIDANTFFPNCNPSVR
ncbi:MAG: S-layer homology domain-containing protein, partial [Chloroflexota bacterium]|nr:S-layer homology domain-containing protein [Chloroflexota bacterium]